MVQLFGRVDESRIVNGQQQTVFIIPAFAETAARARAIANSRSKGLENAEIENIEVVGSTDTPGQSFYKVTVLSDR